MKLDRKMQEYLEQEAVEAARQRFPELGDSNFRCRDVKQDRRGMVHCLVTCETSWIAVVIKYDAKRLVDIQGLTWDTVYTGLVFSRDTVDEKLRELVNAKLPSGWRVEIEEISSPQFVRFENRGLRIGVRIVARYVYTVQVWLKSDRKRTYEVNAYPLYDGSLEANWVDQYGVGFTPLKLETYNGRRV